MRTLIVILSLAGSAIGTALGTVYSEQTEQTDRMGETFDTYAYMWDSSAGHLTSGAEYEFMDAHGWTCWVELDDDGERRDYCAPDVRDTAPRSN